MSSIKCGGNCCESFCTNYSPSEWSRHAKAIRNKKKTFGLDNGTRRNVSSNDKDVLYIADMLILVKEDRRRKHKLNENGTNHRFIYTCKHFDKETRMCKQYSKRPKMCSEYPENTPKGVCLIDGCNCK